MQTLSFGYKQPETGDPGSVWFPAIEDNIERLNDHTHNGTDSAQLTPSSLSKSAFKSTILAVGWSAGSNGNYSQTITVPAGVTEINNYVVIFYITSSGVRVFPTMQRVSETTYTLTVNNSALALTAVYV